MQHTNIFSPILQAKRPHSTYQTSFILILKAKNILIQHTKYLYSLHILLANQHHSTHQTSFSDSVTTISSFYTLNIFVLIMSCLFIMWITRLEYNFWAYSFISRGNERISPKIKYDNFLYSRLKDHLTKLS